METNLIKLIFSSVLVGYLFILPSAIADNSKHGKALWVKTEVIDDRGGQSIKQYLPHNEAGTERKKERYKARQSTKLVNAHFPVVTKSMTVGKVTADEASDVKYQVAIRPMFIIGYDPVSIKWLKLNRSLLAEKKAIGLVVNVETVQEMDVLQNIVGKDVMMQPTPGDRLAKNLKIKHYPFYMDNEGVMR